jgi:hypothetical protein
MKNKFYSFLFLVFIIAAALPAGAQDTIACNARFGVAVYESSADFRAVDSLPGVQHSWDFGDSVILGFGSSVAVTHNYSHYGTFKVVHLIRNPATGCAASSAQWITLSPPSYNNCGIGMTVRRDSLDHHLYRLIANPYVPAGTVDTIAWTIDGSFSGIGDTLTRTWSNGSHSVCVTLYTSLGCLVRVYTFPRSGHYDVMVYSYMDSGYHCFPWTIQGINVDSAGTTDNYVTSYPNPAASQAGIDLTLPQPAMIYIRVYNSMGNPVLSTSVPGSQGMNHVKVPISGLGSGIYYIQVQYGQESKMSKIQKL